MLADMYAETLKSIQLNTEIENYFLVEELDSITYSCKLSMMMLQHSDFFNANSDKILSNIECQKPLLNELMDRPELAGSSDLLFTTAINRIKPLWMRNQVGIYNSNFGPFTGEEVKFHPREFNKKGFAFTLLLDRAELVQHIDSDIALPMLQSSIVEVMELAMELKQEAVEHAKNHADVSTSHDALSNKVEKLTKDKTSADEEIKRLKADIKENTRLLKAAETTIANAQAKFDKLSAELEAERAKVVEKLILDERVRLVGTVSRLELALYMPAEQITVAKTVTSLKTAMEKVRKQTSGLLWFVDLEGLTTKESFEVEQWMKKNQLAYRVVSGSTVEVIQRILVDIQGDMQYETNE
jgi:molecular chaperone GrpE (heat shock protein)